MVRPSIVKDAEWIADLLCHGLVRGSFIPPLLQRDLRDLTRQLSAYYGRLVARRGAKKAIVAVAHKLITIGYTLLRNRELYQEPGAAALAERRVDKLLTRLRHTIEQLSYTVTLEPAPTAAA